MKTIVTSNMPKSNGHYSQVISHNGLLYLSGQLPIEPTTKKIPVGIEEQTKQALSNVALLLEEAGSSLHEVIQVRIYLSKIDLWSQVNLIYASFFGTHKPVRSIVPTRELHFGCLIEIEAIAALPDNETS